MKPIRFFSGESQYPFMKQHKPAYVFSALLIVATIVLIAVRGINWGIDFTGGVVMEARLAMEADIARLRDQLTEGGMDEAVLQTVDTPQDIMIRLRPETDDEAARNAVIASVKAILEQHYEGVEYRKVDFLGPQIGSELIEKGAISLLLAFIAVMGYMWFRSEWQFGVGAIVALLHDAIITLGFFSLLQIEFSSASVAAILTIIGYSINDTVVIYDRLRENLRKYKKKPLAELIDKSVNQTLSRTILTAGTTIVVLLALVLMGGNVLYGFAMVLLFGVIIGTYSSIYIASPVLLNLKFRQAG